MIRVALLLLVTLPLLAQHRPGVSRVPFPEDGPQRDPARLVFTPDGVLWAASITNGVLDRIVPGDGATAFPLPHWGGTYDLTVGPDGAVWIGARDYVARHDPATNELRRWTQYRDVWFIESGSDGNLWFLHRPRFDELPRLVRLTTTGAELSSVVIRGDITGATFGSDGAFWIARREGLESSLLRVDAQGATSTFGVDFAGRLFAAPGFLWLTSDDRMLRVSLDGVTLDRFPLAMTAAGADRRNGNLWLRARTELGEEVGRLSPLGILTRFGPLEPLPSGPCPHTQPVYGEIAVAPDGRVAMTDYYPLYGYVPENPCAYTRFDSDNTLTFLDPAAAPVIEVRSLSTRVRRRAGRS